ncbi:hypothetical protein [Micromonospora sp. NPDC005806]|uniref:hypothetical protein n=1 Tax=Micromonospora sp. NPDC005806 TaxID=3364234 RepID=UPI0036AB26D1
MTDIGDIGRSRDCPPALDSSVRFVELGQVELGCAFSARGIASLAAHADYSKGLGVAGPEPAPLLTWA